MLLTQAEASALAQIDPGHLWTYAPAPGQEQGGLTFPNGTAQTAIEATQSMLDGYRAGAIAVPVPAPTSLTRLGLMRAFTEQGLWTEVKGFIASRPLLQEQWDLATELKLSDPIVQEAIGAFAAQGIPIDPVKLAIRANQLVA